MEVIRRKNRPAREFYLSGAPFSQYFEERTEISVPEEIFPEGKVAAELVTWYESGAVKRIFPLYGQISAYWSEEDEFSLFGDSIPMRIPGNGICRVFPEDVYLYESGKLRAITLWKRTTLTIQTKQYGPIRTHFGAEFYESGALKSIEPAFGTRISVDGRTISVYDPDVLRLHAEHNSLQFDERGSVISWKEFTGKPRVLSERERIFGIKIPEFKS